MSSDHWRMRLNNYLQERGERSTLSWDVWTTGPAHRLTWHAILYVRGCQMGTARGQHRGAVKEEAARQAYLALHNTYSS
ncbi:hypothetical protein CERSUDRAFT_99807 [Gelatoporia subvermispora B]|uniref:DRBM domain-containing protein n=1 Tax=Ceriporiopsis subvermispora (strain B) TaxID=914234 RepID=M2QJ36_CERS8|nr:hypothetical protein CERSUDRAFT_99807 [Gelatoporia subvermispora B]